MSNINRILLVLMFLWLTIPILFADTLSSVYVQDTLKATSEITTQPVVYERVSFTPESWVAIMAAIIVPVLTFLGTLIISWLDRMAIRKREMEQKALEKQGEVYAKLADIVGKPTLTANDLTVASSYVLQRYPYMPKKLCTEAKNIISHLQSTIGGATKNNQYLKNCLDVFLAHFETKYGVIL